jgi:CRISPR/Cas system-associated exonuclease Cas4 (RecB family)
VLSESDDLLPIRLVESYAYCPRQAWYRFVANDDPLNLAMERGLRRHESLDDTPGRDREGGWVTRHLAVRAPVLGAAGVLDEVRIVDDTLTITEYKASRVVPMPWSGILLQLSVQHLALREQVAGGPWRGPALPPPERTTLRVFYADSGRARAVPWSPALDDRARAAIAAGLELFRPGLPPPGRVGIRCRACQHEPICLPDDLPILRSAVR